MTTCEATIGHVLAQSGFPHWQPLRCGQRVGVSTFRDASGQLRFYCQHHEAAVRKLAQYEDALRKAAADRMEEARCLPST